MNYICIYDLSVPLTYCLNLDTKRERKESYFGQFSRKILELDSFLLVNP